MKRKKKKKNKRQKRKFQSDRLQKRVQTSQERSKGQRKNILKGEIEVPLLYLKDGDHILDVIPYYAGKHDPLAREGDPTYTFEYWVHNNVGPNKAWYLCLAEMFNKPCPVCEHRDKLRDKGAKEKVWKALFPKRRNLYNVICYDRGEEKKGVQILDASWHYLEKKLASISKKKARRGKGGGTINFADPYKGRTITFEIEPPKSKNDYPSWEGHAFEDRDYEIDDDTLDSAVVLDEAIVIPSYKEVEKAYWGGKDKDSDTEDDSDDDMSEIEEELEDCEDMEDYEELIERHDIPVKIKKRDDEEDVEEKIKDWIEEQKESGGEEEEDEDEDEDEDEGGDDLSEDDIRDMSYKELKKLIKEHDLDIDLDDFDKDEEEELADEVIDEMEGEGLLK